MLQQLKTFLRDQLGLPPFAVLLVAGFAAHIALNALLRKSPASPWGLLAPLLLGVALEAYEVWHAYRGVGLFAPGNDPLRTILARHTLDVGKMLAGPLLLVALCHLPTR
jgi:hypothetical protein